MDSPSLGIVISSPETPNTCEFDFVIKSAGVHKGEFVQVQTPLGPVLGTVSEIMRSNRYFERAESVAEYSKAGSMGQFPTDEWEYMVARVHVHGILNGVHLTRSSIPVKCGSNVQRAEEEQLKSFLHMDSNGLELGKLRHHSMEVRLNMAKLFQKHLAILAMSGSGKSYLAGVLMEELLERKSELGRIAVLAIDNHGEYAGFSNSVYRTNTQVVKGKDIRIGLRHLSSSKLAEWSSLSKTAIRALDAHMAQIKSRIKSGGEPLGLKELSASVIADSSIKENVKGPLLAALDELESFRLIGKSDTIKSDVLKPGSLCVFDLSDIDDLRRKQIIVAHYAHKFFRKRKKGEIPPFIMLVEEAHNFCPEKMEKSSALSRPIINTIAREGRKFGASLCLISQRPVQLSTTALSQCGTNIILRITNPYDLKHIGESCEGIDSDSLKSITSLKVGEALILGEAVGAPIFVNVRQRRSKIKDASKSLEQIALEFENKTKQIDEEIEAFL